MSNDKPDWAKIFRYEDGQLFWVDSGRNRIMGRSVGKIESKGQRRVVYKSRLYLVSQIVWMMHNGDIPNDLEIDHIDMDRLNNRIENLRLATTQENNRNKAKITSRKTTSKYKGVCWVKGRSKWRAEISIEKYKGQHLGYFVDEIDAARAYDRAAIIHHKSFAQLNFPMEEYE